METGKSSPSRYQAPLEAVGLGEDEIVAYHYILEKGRAKAGSIIRHTELKRGNVYNILHRLVKEGLLEEFEVEGVSHYRPTHPRVLKNKLQLEINDLERKQQSLEEVMPEIVSEYNKSLRKPAVQYFEGSRGMEKVLDDSLEAEETVYTYLDIETLITHLPEVNERHVKKREKKGVKKRGLIIDTPFARDFFKDSYHEEITDTKLIDLGDTPPFATIMQIYDDKVSYITLSETGKIGVIIESPEIYTMHRALFEKLWEQTPGLDL